MGILETVFIGIGLAMDAFAVAICKGLSMKKMSWKKAGIIAIYFGVFQMLMPILGYLLAAGFHDWIESLDHWIAFILLAFIGGKMIKESFGEEENLNDNIDFKSMIVLAIATSIDALAVGITYAFLNTTNIIGSFASIGIITFCVSLIGVKIGNKFGNKYGDKAELVGGIILIFIGAKILLEHANLL